MKRIIAVVILSISLSAGAALPKETITIKTTIYCNHCLRCESCGMNINNTIKEIVSGVSKVRIDPSNHTIMVTYKTEKTNPAEIRNAIAAAGFDADSVKASPDGYAKLDACCKVK